MKNKLINKLHVIAFLFLLGFVTPIFAAVQPIPQVRLTLNAEKWVVSNTSNVSIAIHALLRDQDLADAQQNILQALTKISDQGKWHIVKFMRTKNQANLEQIEAVAEARLPNNAIGDLRNKAKAVSKQGESYEVINIDYTPTEGELSAAQVELRQQIYQQAKKEIQNLKEIFPEQNYYLFSTNFSLSPTLTSGQPQFPAPMYKTAMVQLAGGSIQAGGEGNSQVSQHLRLTAQIILSIPKNNMGKKED